MGRGRAGTGPGEVEPFVVELGILVDELERVFPNARAFVRPGLTLTRVEKRVRWPRLRPLAVRGRTAGGGRRISVSDTHRHEQATDEADERQRAGGLRQRLGRGFRCSSRRQRGRWHLKRSWPQPVGGRHGAAGAAASRALTCCWSALFLRCHERRRHQIIRAQLLEFDGLAVARDLDLVLRSHLPA